MFKNNQIMGKWQIFLLILLERVIEASVLYYFWPVAFARVMECNGGSTIAEGGKCPACCASRARGVMRGAASTAFALAARPYSQWWRLVLWEAWQGAWRSVVGGRELVQGAACIRPCCRQSLSWVCNWWSVYWPKGWAVTFHRPGLGHFWIAHFG